MSKSWITRLASEDVSFLKRFVLASGSLKAVAKEYGVSYPTIRQRLNRLIAKVELFDEQQPLSEFERRLRATVADGRLDPATVEQLLAAHRADLKAHATPSSAATSSDAATQDTVVESDSSADLHTQLRQAIDP